MGYTIKDFIDSNKFPEIKLISDDSGINREIKGARIIAVPDMERFISGGELLLTSLFVYEKLDKHMMLNHLEELNKKQVSGFIIKRHNTAHLNQLFDALLHFCAEHNIPVLEIPQDLSYWSIIKYLLLRTFNIEIAKSVYSKMTRDEINYLFTDEFSCDRFLKNLLSRAEKILGNSIALYDENYHNIYPGTAEASEFEISKDNTQYIPNIISKYEYIRQKRVNVEYIKKINILNQHEFYLVISEVNEPLIEMDFIALDSVMSPLMYVLTQTVAEKNIEKKYHKDLEYRMLNGSLSDKEEDEVADLLNLNETDDYRVITFYLRPESHIKNLVSSKRKKQNFLKKKSHIFGRKKIFIVIQIESYVFIRKIKRKISWKAEENWRNSRKNCRISWKKENQNLNS